MFSDPNKNVWEFGFIPGQKVADMGSGAGHYALALSRALGPLGQVYAVDISRSALSRLESEARSKERKNIETREGDIERARGTGLSDGEVDGAVFSNILFQLLDKAAAASEAARIVRPGGRVCVVEWADLGFIKNSLAERGARPVRREEAKRLFESAGFSFLKAFDAGEHHYGLIFVKPIQ